MLKLLIPEGEIMLKLLIAKCAVMFQLLSLTPIRGQNSQSCGNHGTNGNQDGPRQ